MYFKKGDILPTTTEDGFKALVFNHETGYFDLKNIDIPRLSNLVENQKDIRKAEQYLEFGLYDYIATALRFDSIDNRKYDNFHISLVSTVNAVVKEMLETGVTSINEVDILKRLCTEYNLDTASIMSTLGVRFADLLRHLTTYNLDSMFYFRYATDSYIILGVNNSVQDNLYAVEEIIDAAKELGFNKHSFITTYLTKDVKNTILILSDDNSIDSTYLADQAHVFYLSDCNDGGWAETETTLGEVIIE